MSTDVLPAHAGPFEEIADSTIPTSHGSARVVHSSRQLPAEAWHAAFPGENRDCRYYELIEETLPDQFEYRYLVLTNSRTGQTVVQPYFIVNQQVTDGLPRSARNIVARVQKFWPRFLVMRVLMVGCAAGEGQLASSEPWVVQSLREALCVAAKRDRAAMIVFKDYPSRHREALRMLEENGFKRVPSMPAAKVDLFEYKDFDDYMQRHLGKVFRKNLRRKFRVAEEFGPIEMTVHEDIAPLVDEIHALYRQTHDRADFAFETLTPEFFARIGREMGDRTRFFIWRHEGKIVAFNFCLLSEGVLYDMDIGLDYNVALDMHLYFVTWRDLVSWAIRNGVRTYYTAQLSYDPKLHLRLLLAPLDLYIAHTSPLINPFFRVAMGFLQPVRHHPILRKFPNAHEM